MEEPPAVDPTANQESAPVEGWGDLLAKAKPLRRAPRVQAGSPEAEKKPDPGQSDVGSADAPPLGASSRRVVDFSAMMTGGAGAVEAAPAEKPPAPAETDEWSSPASRTSTRRGKPNLSALDGDAPTSQPPAEAASGTEVAGQRASRMAGKRLDKSELLGLYAEEDQPQASPARTLSAAKAQRKDKPNYRDLLAAAQGPEAKTAENSALGGEAAAEEGAAQGGNLVIPPELKEYISPELWRRLNGTTPPRGVLVNVLERMRSVLYLISTFLPRYLVQEKMRRPAAGLVRGEMLEGTLLFSDVSGFTALSERLQESGPDGAGRMTEVMNRYFGVMLDIVARSNGILLKFAGDAMLVYFPDKQLKDDGDVQEMDAGAHAAAAMRAGQRMLAAMADFTQIETPAGSVQLRMKIGIASGRFIGASVGDDKRMEYIVLGPAVSQTMAAEGHATSGGQLVMNAEAVAQARPIGRLGKLKDDFYLLEAGPAQKLDDFEIQAESRRARGALSWDASPQAIMAQTTQALRQVQALRPYLAPELVEVVVQPGKRELVSQYRPTTVIFCNFTGPEALLDLWGAAGVQRVTSLLDGYFNTMSDVIARFGGIVSRIDPYSKGSKLLVLFGAPVAHEDDAQRAVSAALTMQAALDGLEEDFRRKYARHLPANWDGPLIQQRIGVTSGTTYAGQVGSSTRREYTVMGDDVNLSARLMSTAEMGRVLVNQAVADNVADYFVLTRRPEIKVKGKSKPIPTFQVEGPQDAPLVRRMHSRGPLIAREANLEAADDLVGKALAGAGRTLVIRGPAGVGKSHVADEIMRRAEARGAQLAFILCHSYNADTPFAAWRQLLINLAKITSLDYSPRLQAEKFQRLMAQARLPEGSQRPLAALAGIRLVEAESAPAAQPTEATSDEEKSQGDLRQLLIGGGLRKRGSSLDALEQLERREIAVSGLSWGQLGEQLSEHQQDDLDAALVALLAGLTVNQPLAVFFEDGHWMDRPSRRQLGRLQAGIAKLPVLFLVARRGQDEIEIGQTLELAPFDPAGTRSLVAHLLTTELADIIHTQSHGTPLMVEMITRWFQRTHHISADELREALDESDFLQKLMLSSLESLPEGQREAARAAAVVGVEFRFSEVQALLPQVDAVTLSNYLIALKQAGQIYAVEELRTDTRYAFHQNQVRDILYNSLPQDKRREMHARLAEHLGRPPSSRNQALARLGAALGGVQASPMQEAETIARHYELAEQWLPAARGQLKAANLARQARQYEKALEQYGRALGNLNRLTASSQLAAGNDVEAAGLRQEATVGQGDVSMIVGYSLSASGAYESAYNSLPAETPVEARSDLARKLALALTLAGRAGDGLSLLRGIAPQPAAASRPGVAAGMAWLLWRSPGAGKGQPNRSEMQAWIARSRELLDGRIDPPAAAVAALVDELAGEVMYAAMDYMTLEWWDGAALAAIRLGDRQMEAGDLAGALRYYENAARTWRQVVQNASRPAGALPLALYRQAEVHWRNGDAALARKTLEEALAALDRSALSFQANGHAAIQRALKLTATRRETGRGDRSKTWPACDWQAFDDEFHSAVLFAVE